MDSHATWSQTDISEDEARQLVKDITDQATAKCQGNSPGHLTQVLKDLAKAVVHWRELLRQYIGNHVGNRRLTYSRRNRRQDTFGLPGISHHAAGRVCVIVDSSGSISDVELAQFFSEIEMISSRAKVHVLQWDYSFQGYGK
jgi:predicted metal-dependent peptidase